MPNDPITEPIMRHWERPLTAPLSTLVDYARDIYLANGVHDMMHSRVPRPDLGQVSVIGLSREPGRRFNERGRRMVELAHGELAARIAVPPTQAAEQFNRLPTRLQELATHLRGPMSEKAIAVHMRLSPHTVHNYAKTLYRKLGVASRSEAAHALKALDQRGGTRHELMLA